MNARIVVVVIVAVFAGGGVVVPAAGAAAPRTPASLYAKSCQNQSKQRLPGLRTTSYGKCVTAMTRLAQARTHSPATACATLSRKHIVGTRTSAFARCVAAGRALMRRGNGIDLAFVEAMIAHHVSAVEMAQYAVLHAESDVIRHLAANIVSSQNAEIATMRQIAAQLRGAGIRPVALGLSRAQMGMDHDMSHIVGAHPFDIVFVDMMIPHHQGAIRMTNVLLAKATGSRTQALANQIAAAQAREIQQMLEFRLQTAGAPPIVDDHTHHDDHPH